MFFTLDDYLKILEWLRRHSIKDSELPTAEDFEGGEYLAMIQNGTNVKVSLVDFAEQLMQLGVPDFINVSSRYNERYISLILAVNLVPVNARKYGQVITFLDTDGNWQLYQFVGESLTQWLNLHCWDNLISNISGGLTPDNEDLVIAENEMGDKVVKFKDKKYDEDSFSGLGRVYLRKNITVVEDENTHLGKLINLLTLNMIGKENTIYIIQYDYDLNNETIIIPENCILKFEGGSLSNGIIVGNNTTINSTFVKIFSNIVLNGSFNGIGYTEWLGVIPNIPSFCVCTAINILSAVFEEIKLFSGKYYKTSSDNIVISKPTKLIGQTTGINEVSTVLIGTLEEGQDFITLGTPQESSTDYNRIINIVLDSITVVVKDSNTVKTSCIRVLKTHRLLLNNIYIRNYNTKKSEWTDEELENAINCCNYGVILDAQSELLRITNFMITATIGIYFKQRNDFVTISDGNINCDALNGYGLAHFYGFIFGDNLKINNVDLALGIYNFYHKDNSDNNLPSYGTVSNQSTLDNIRIEQSRTHEKGTFMYFHQKYTSVSMLNIKNSSINFYNNAFLDIINEYNGMKNPLKINFINCTISNYKTYEKDNPSIKILYDYVFLNFLNCIADIGNSFEIPETYNIIGPSVNIYNKNTRNLTSGNLYIYYNNTNVYYSINEYEYKRNDTIRLDSITPKTLTFVQCLGATITNNDQIIFKNINYIDGVKAKITYNGFYGFEEITIFIPIILNENNERVLGEIKTISQYSTKEDLIFIISPSQSSGHINLYTNISISTNQRLQGIYKLSSSEDLTNINEILTIETTLYTNRILVHKMQE